jgi:hypothetical protein
MMIQQAKIEKSFPVPALQTSGNIPTGDLDGCNPLIRRYTIAYLINFPSQLSTLNFFLAI